jgi:hypothetical protein
MSKKIFKGKTIEHLYEEIYNDQSQNAQEILKIIEQLTKLVGDATDAAVLAPMIGAMLGNKIRNTQLLIELTKVIQRSLEPATSKRSEVETKLDYPKDEIIELLNSYNIIED